jgi:hypothetical protein
MNTWIQVGSILILAVGAAALMLRAKPRRDPCRPPSNEERMLAYIERRAAWECERRKAKLLQRQRVQRRLEQRWLRSAPGSSPIQWPTVPAPRAPGGRA